MISLAPVWECPFPKAKRIQFNFKNPHNLLPPPGTFYCDRCGPWGQHVPRHHHGLRWQYRPGSTSTRPLDVTQTSDINIDPGCSRITDPGMALGYSKDQNITMAHGGGGQCGGEIVRILEIGLDTFCFGKWATIYSFLHLSTPQPWWQHGLWIWLQTSSQLMDVFMALSGN